MSDKEKACLERFLEDTELLDELTQWQADEFNIFDILKISRTEIRHSNVLAWLLDANGNHMLGDYFFRNVLRSILYNAEDGRYDKTKVLLFDLYSFKVLREHENIDLLLVSDNEKAIIVIENKVGSSEHSNQLNRYRDYVNKRYKDYYKMFVYLTSKGENPSDEDNWSILSYDDLYKILDDVLAKKEINDSIRLFIGDYKKIIRRDIVTDQELKDLCNKIYEKHKDAINLIIDNADMDNDRSRISNGVKKALKEYHQLGKIIYLDKHNFLTKEMNEIIPKYTGGFKGSWGTDLMYYNWIETWDNTMYVRFELSGDNINDEQKEVAKKLIDICEPKNKNIPFKYKRLVSFKEKIDSDNDVEEAAYENAKNLIEKLLKKEHEIYLKMTK